MDLLSPARLPDGLCSMFGESGVFYISFLGFSRHAIWACSVSVVERNNGLFDVLFAGFIPVKSMTRILVFVLCTSCNNSVLHADAFAG